MPAAAGGEKKKKKSCLNVYEGYRVLDVINKCLILCIAVMKEVPWFCCGVHQKVRGVRKRRRRGVKM